MTTPATNIPRIGLSAAEAAKVLGVGRSLLLQLDRTGELGPKFRRLGARRILSVRELTAWVDHGCPSRPEWLKIWARIISRAEGIGGTVVSDATLDDSRRQSLYGSKGEAA